MGYNARTSGYPHTALTRSFSTGNASIGKRMIISKDTVATESFFSGSPLTSATSSIHISRMKAGDACPRHAVVPSVLNRTSTAPAQAASSYTLHRAVCDTNPPTSNATTVSIIQRACTVGSPVGINFAESTKTDLGRKKESIEGLAAFLESRGLSEHQLAIESWCRSMGAAFLHEILENLEDLADSLKLSKEQRQQLMENVEQCEQPMAHAVKHEAVKTVPERTVTLHGAPLQHLNAKCSVHTGSALGRTCTTPVTTNEARAASERAAKAYIPLNAWPQFGHRISCDVKNLMANSEVVAITDLENSVLSYDDGDPTDQIVTGKVRQKNPVGKEMRRYQRPSVHSTKLADPTANGNLGRRSKLVSTGNQATNSETPGAFQNLQHQFIKRYADELRSAFGPEAEITPAEVNPAVQNKFLHTLHRARQKEVRLGYHGTPHKNIPKILETGLRIPGHGGVKVAHGSAHGVGIYTARLGGARLSQGFTNSPNMLVCGVIDDPDEDSFNASGLPKYGFNHSILRIGRPAKQRDMPTVPRSIQIQQRVGNYTLHRNTGDVLHVGEAQVIFNESIVVPLLKVDNMPRSLYQPHFYSAPVTGAAASQVVADVQAAWEEGNANRDQEILLPLTSPVGAHELKVRRRQSRRVWQDHRKLQRQVKSR